MNTKVRHKIAALAALSAILGALRVGGKTIDSQNVRDPVVGFIFGSAGLMYNLTLEGTRFTIIQR